MRGELFSPQLAAIQRWKGNETMWKVSKIQFTGDAFYPFRVFLRNGYMNDARQIWAVPNLDNDTYDLTDATFAGLSDLQGRS